MSIQPPAGRPQPDLLDPGAGGNPSDSLASVYAREERWEELAAHLIERAEAAPDPAPRAAELLQAARVFETNLEDHDKACLILQTAFEEDPQNDQVARELARVAAGIGRWPELLAELEAGASTVEPLARRLALLVAVGRAHDERQDEAGAERAYVSAVGYDPAHPAAVRALCDLYERRGDWGRVAHHLARASAAAQRPAEAARLALEAAVIYQNRLDDGPHAAE